MIEGSGIFPTLRSVLARGVGVVRRFGRLSGGADLQADKFRNTTARLGQQWATCSFG
jgi:hypothetical protein